LLIIYVRGLCLANQSIAPQIIEAAGMLQKKEKAKIPKQIFLLNKDPAPEKFFLLLWQEGLKRSWFPTTVLLAIWLDDPDGIKWYDFPIP